MANTLYPQLQDFQLYSSGAAIGDTSVTLTTMKTIDGVQLTMANFGDKGFITIDPGAGTLEEQISFSGITANANGTTTLTGVKTVLCLSPYTETSGLAKQHSGGAVAAVAVTSGLLNQFANKGNAETITGVYTFTSTAKAKYNTHPTFSADAEIIDKKYVDDAIVAGAPDASETTKGIVQLATGAELAAGTSAGTTGARLVPATSSCKGTTAGAADANKIPVLDAAGVLSQTFLDSARTWGAVQSFTADNAQITTDANTANDAVRYSLLQSEISKGYTSGTAGETLAVGDAVYIKNADTRLWKADTDGDESTFSFVGIITTGGTAGNTVYYAKPGDVATGLTGLTVGASYYLTGAAGVIGTTPGTRYAKIGIALTTTTLQVKEPKFIAYGTQTFSSTTTAAQTCGFRPARITLYANISVGNSTSHTDQAENNVCMRDLYQTGSGNTWFTWDASNAYFVADSPTTRHNGTISAFSATGFTLSNTKTSSAGNVDIYWTAFSE